MELFRQNKKDLLVEDIRKMEVEAIRKMTEKPSLPECENLADQIARNAPLSTRAKAFIYSAFWLTAVPLTISTVLAVAQFMIFKSDLATCSLWYYCAGGFLAIYGLFNGAAKRLFIGYIVGFRGATNALKKGWNGGEYGGVYQIDDYIYKRDILKIWK